MTCCIRPMTYTAPSLERVTNVSASIRLPLIRQDRFGKYHRSLRIFKIERKRQQSWEKKQNSQTLAPDVTTGRRKKGGKKSILWPQERATVAYVKYQITITFTSLPEAHDSIIWADTTYYRLRVMDVVCLFCGQFAELMVFAVRYERKQNGIIWRLSFLPTSFVQYCGAIQFNHESREM